MIHEAFPCLWTKVKTFYDLRYKQVCFYFLCTILPLIKNHCRRRSFNCWPDTTQTFFPVSCVLSSFSPTNMILSLLSSLKQTEDLWSWHEKNAPEFIRFLKGTNQNEQELAELVVLKRPKFLESFLSRLTWIMVILRNDCKSKWEITLSSIYLSPVIYEPNVFSIWLNNDNPSLKMSTLWFSLILGLEKIPGLSMPFDGNWFICIQMQITIKWSSLDTIAFFYLSGRESMSLL